MNLKDQFEQVCIVESLAHRINRGMTEQEGRILKDNTLQLTKRERFRVAKLDNLLREIRVAQNANDELLELKLLKKLAEIENG